MPLASGPKSPGTPSSPSAGKCARPLCPSATRPCSFPDPFSQNPNPSPPGAHFPVMESVSQSAVLMASAGVPWKRSWRLSHPDSGYERGFHQTVSGGHSEVVKRSSHETPFGVIPEPLLGLGTSLAGVPDRRACRGGARTAQGSTQSRCHTLFRAPLLFPLLNFGF